MKLVVDGDEGAYVICTSSPLAEAHFIASWVFCITRHCGKMLTTSGPSGLGKRNSPSMVILQDSNEGENINPEWSYLLYLHYCMDMAMGMGYRSGVLTRHRLWR